MKKQINYYSWPKNGIEIIHARNSSTSYPRHNHVATYVIGFLLKGKIILTREDKRALQGPKTGFIIPPYEPHAITASKPYDLLSLCLHKSTFDKYGTDALKKQVRRYLTEILPLGTMEDRDYAVLDSAIEATSRYHENNKCKTQSQPLSQLRANMEAGIENQDNIREMAEAVFASKYHFIRQFKKGVGLTPHHFQIQNRIRKAQKMLPDALSLTDVALATGFYDQSHFIRHFRKMLGMTPREYIRACQTLPE